MSVSRTVRKIYQKREVSQTGFPVGHIEGHMTTVELLRARAAQIDHAIVRDRIIDSDGRVEAEREFHYLTCRRCDLERQADFIEKQGQK